MGGKGKASVTANQQPGLFDHLGEAWGGEPVPTSRGGQARPVPKKAGPPTPPRPAAPLPWAEVVAKGPKAQGPNQAPGLRGMSADDVEGPALLADPPEPDPRQLSPLDTPSRPGPAPVGEAMPPPAPPAPVVVGTLAEVGAVLASSAEGLQVSLLLDGRPHRLGLGPEGLKLWRGEELVGESGWASLGAHLGHQRARMATLIGARRVPANLLVHPEFTSGILPHLYVNAYHGDRLARGALRRRVEVRASDLATVERLMAVEVACANPDCLHAIHPFRPRAKGNPLRLFVGFTCPLEESVACARTRGAKEAMEALVLRVEALGQVAGNDVRR